MQSAEAALDTLISEITRGRLFDFPFQRHAFLTLAYHVTRPCSTTELMDLEQLFQTTLQELPSSIAHLGTRQPAQIRQHVNLTQVASTLRGLHLILRSLLGDEPRDELRKFSDAYEGLINPANLLPQLDDAMHRVRLSLPLTVTYAMKHKKSHTLLAIARQLGHARAYLLGHHNRKHVTHHAQELGGYSLATCYLASAFMK